MTIFQVCRIYGGVGWLQTGSFYRVQGPKKVDRLKRSGIACIHAFAKNWSVPVYLEDPYFRIRK